MPGMPEPGVEWAGFRIEERVGAGGFGQVFSAWDLDGERRVVLKVVPQDADPASRDRFLRESRMAAELDHPRIVPIHRVDEIDGMALVVMDDIAGGDLGQQIHAGPLTLDRTRSVLGQLGGALDRAHRAGLVHRGVEPANILCAEDGDEVFLADFGAPAASVHHASPEFVRGEVLTPASDVYSLGCTLFECLTGRVPFPAATPAEVAQHHVDSPPPAVTELRPDLPTTLDEIVARAMAKSPSERFPSTRHLAEAVALVRPGSPEPTTRADLGPAPFATTAATTPVPEEVGGSPEPSASRSVFDDTTAMPVVTDEPRGDDDTPAPTGDGALDGADFGIYEDDGRRSRVPAVLVALLVVATAVVGVLAWRAINTDADLASSGTSTTTEPPPDLGSEVPTVAAAEALVPEGIDTCVSPEGEAAEAVPIVLLCPLDGVPEAMSLELFDTAEARDERFDALAGERGVPDRDDAECALGRTGRHPFEAEGHGGMVACTEGGGVVDFMWTRDDAPVVLSAHGGGRFAEYEAAWEALAGRTDAQFPTSEEQDLLDALPDDYLVDCSRDLTLALEAGGVVAAACRPTEEAPNVISWVLFDDDAPMERWIAGRRDALEENNFDQTDDGCSPQGFGQVATITEEPVEEPTDEEAEQPDGPAEPSGPPPAAAYLDYAIDGSNGTVLCFINTSGLNAVFWTRDGSQIASIAVSDRGDGDSMADLLRWWRDGGHRP